MLCGVGSLFADAGERRDPEEAKGGGWLPLCDCGVSDGVLELLLAVALSASLFSSILKSVRSTSSSLRRPESLSKASIRPRRFSSPSMYLALKVVGKIHVHRISQPTLWEELASSRRV